MPKPVHHQSHKAIVADASEANSKKSPKPSNFVQNQPITQLVSCPSFEDEPWASRATALRPAKLDQYIDLTKPTPPPLPYSNPYVRLYLDFLATVPKECWIDEDNDED